MVIDGHPLGEPNQFVEGVQSNRSNSLIRSVNATLVRIFESWSDTRN